MKIAVVTSKSALEKGGAENFYEGLIKALRDAGHDATQIEVLADESTFEKILEAYCNCYYLDLSHFDIVISTKAPTYMVRHPNHISYLLHTIRVFYDMFDREFDSRDSERQKQRRLIHALDKYGLKRAKKHYVIGQTVVERLRAADSYYNNIDFEVLYPAPIHSLYSESNEGEYIFMPGRLHRWKRVDLAINAMRYVSHKTKLLIAGEGEDGKALMDLTNQLGLGERVKFLGRVSDERLLKLYSKCLAVIFTPMQEDFGYIAVESFKSKKPVITCKDSGEPSLIVKDKISGFVVEPDPKKIAEMINYLVENPQEAISMGMSGHACVQEISWENVVSRLLKDVDIAAHEDAAHQIDVLILDMQPIEPAVGGGRLRLKGLYSHLPANLRALYIGTYDWQGPKHRELRISKSLKELDIPLQEEHFRINEHLNSLLPGKTIIDVLFPLLAKASPEYVQAACQEAKKADVIVISHPWLYPLIKTEIDLKNKILIYDSQNCEAALRQEILGSTAFARCIAHMVKFVERELCEECDLVLSCSQEDKGQFEKLYKISSQKIEVYPNGVDADCIKPKDDVFRNLMKKEMKIDNTAAIFIGSNFPPNLEAAKYIIDTLSNECPEITFLIVGGVGASLDSNKNNVKIFGQVSEDDKSRIFAAADIAINPISHGSGTNIKMFEYLAAGLPTISTPVGARGIKKDDSFVVCDLQKFPEEIRKLAHEPELYKKLSRSGRALAENDYNWRKISYDLGQRISELYKSQSPMFSVIVPTYRGEHIYKLFDKLNGQTFKDFEVIVVDSGVERGECLHELAGFKLKYIFKRDIGPAKARNIGIEHARGRIIAFTDDDCQPDANWLDNAKNHFDNSPSVGLEGRVYTDESKLNDPNYRAVTNKGLEGLGFMTANLFMRRDIINKIGGFDERFDRPHFREDTDLAWRALDHGTIPLAEDVCVFHPAHLRDIEGESTEERDGFFVNDALLFSKHPKRYIDLMRAEGHFRSNKNFWRHFKEGCKRVAQRVPLEEMAKYRDIREYMPED